MRFPVKIWQWSWSFNENVLHWNNTEDGSIKKFSRSILDMNFLQLKIDELIGFFKLYTTVGLTKWHGTLWKRDFCSELLKYAGKVISSTALMEKNYF